METRYKGQVLCSNYKCGGFTKGPSPNCPEGCKCGPVNPRIPDAPRTCVNSPVSSPLWSPSKGEQIKINLECAKEFGFPECLVYRTCKPKDVGMEITDQEWKDRHNKGSLANQKYAKAKCWELCVAMKRGNETPNFMLKQQMEALGCIKSLSPQRDFPKSDKDKRGNYKDRKTSSKYGQIPEALPWIIGTGIAVFIIYKFK